MLAVYPRMYLPQDHTSTNAAHQRKCVLHTARNTFHLALIHAERSVTHCHILCVALYFVSFCMQRGQSLIALYFVFLRPTVQYCWCRNENPLRIQSSQILLLKPGVGQNIAMHASLTASDFFFANFYLPSAFISIFFQSFS